MKRYIIAAVVAVTGLSTAAQSASTFHFNNVRVNSVDETVFEVVPRNFGRTDDIWCGASEYAVRKLGADWQAPLYVVRGRGESATTGRRTAVQFTLSPEAAGVTPIDVGIRTGFRVGDNMSIQAANGFCNRIPIRNQ